MQMRKSHWTLPIGMPVVTNNFFRVLCLNGITVVSSRHSVRTVFRIFYNPVLLLKREIQVRSFVETDGFWQAENTCRFEFVVIVGPKNPLTYDGNALLERFNIGFDGLPGSLTWHSATAIVTQPLPLCRPNPDDL